MKSFITKSALLIMAGITLGGSTIAANADSFANGGALITTVHHYRHHKKFHPNYKIPAYKNKKAIKEQASHMHVSKKFTKEMARLERKYQGKNWFRDGLNNRQLRARGWVSFHESSDRWNVLSYGGVCIGYFQMNPAYLGRRHGHTNLNHRHQVKVADAYVKIRYGNWTNAKRFWENHNWY